MFNKNELICKCPLCVSCHYSIYLFNKYKKKFECKMNPKVKYINK